MKKGGGGRETRLGACALEKQGRAEMKSTIPRVSPPGSASSSSACVLCGPGQVTQPLCASVASSAKKTPGRHRGIIAIIVGVVVSPREGYRAFLARPGTPLPPLGRVSLPGDLSTMGLTMMRSGVSSGTPSAQHGSWRAEAGAGRKRAGGQCFALELARNRGLSWSLRAAGC